MPRQNSSGCKERLGHISQQGDRYLRKLLVGSASAVVRHARLHPGKRPWIDQLLARRPAKVVIVALNPPRTKLIRDDTDAVRTKDGKALVLHHAVEPQDVRDTAVLLREFELNRDIEPGDTQIFPVVDTARGLMRAGDIASAAPRVGGLVFHSRN